MWKLMVAAACLTSWLCGACADDAGIEGTESGLSSVVGAIGGANGNGNGGGNGNHANNGTKLSGTLTADVACNPDGSSMVTITGHLESSGSADSAVITFDGDLALLGSLVVEPQDWTHDGPIKFFDASVDVPFPNGAFEGSACVEQSGAKGRKSKAICVPLTFVVDCPTCEENCEAYTSRLYDECVSLLLPLDLQQACDQLAPGVQASCVAGSCTCEPGCEQIAADVLAACEPFSGAVDCEFAAVLSNDFCRQDFCPDPCADPVCGDGLCCPGEDLDSCAADCTPPPDPCLAPECGDGVCCVVGADGAPGEVDCDADCGEPCQGYCPGVECVPPVDAPADFCDVVPPFCANFCDVIAE